MCVARTARRKARIARQTPKSKRMWRTRQRATPASKAPIKGKK